MQNTQYFDRPETMEGTVEALTPTLVSASETDQAYYAELIRNFATSISPRSNIPMGYSLYYLIMHTERSSDAPGLSSDALYNAFRRYAPNVERILNIKRDQFEGHLERWVKANSLLYSPADVRSHRGVSHVAGLTFRDTPLSDEAVKAYAEGLAFGR